VRDAAGATGPLRRDRHRELFGILSDKPRSPGSLGMLPRRSRAGGIGLYEPVHGSAPDIAGQDVANPLAAILSAAMLFEHSFAAIAAAQQIRDAVTAVLDAGHRTADLLLPGEQRAAIGCRAMGDLVVAKLGA
jgi:3-isopropylmalate dehydrogenase